MVFSLDALKDRDARRIFAGQLVSQACDKMMSVGLIWIIGTEYSSEWIPGFLAASALPHLLLAAFAGGWAQKIGALRSVIRTDVLRGALFFLLGFFWYAKAGSPLLSDQRGLAILFIATLISNSLGAIFNPAIMTLPSLLERKDLIPQLTAIVDSCFSFGNILGPVIAAVAYPRIGLAGLLMVNGVSYLWAASIECNVRTIALDSPLQGSLAASPSQGLQKHPVFSDRLVFVMLGILLLTNLALTPVIAFLPLFAKDRYQGGIDLLAWLELSVGAGTVAGTVLLSMVRIPLNTGKIVVLGLACISAMYLLFGYSSNPLIGCLSLAALGFTLSLINISALTFFQTHPAPDAVPTVMSWVNLTSVGALPFSMLLTAALLRQAEAPHLAMIFASALAIFSFGASFHRELRSI